MPAGLMQSVDVLKINNSEELFGIINEVITLNPELNWYAASPVKKNEYQSIRMTQLPATAFRKPNEGRPFQTAVFQPTLHKCFFIDASWIQDVAIAEQHDWGKEGAWRQQTQSHLQSAFFQLSKQIYYGVKNDSLGFPGIVALMNEFGTATNMTYEVAPTATTNLTSVYAVRTGLLDSQIAWGSEGQFVQDEIKQQLWPTNTAPASAAGFQVYTQRLGGWVGFQVVSQWSLGRISKISTGTNQGLTDNHLFEYLSRCPADKEPQAWFMTRRSQEQLRRSRTATNATGAPAPTPTEVAGIPIIVTGAISDKEETILTP